MNMRWRWMGYVDRALPLTRDERLAAQARANRIGDGVKHLRLKVILATLALPVMVIGAGPVAVVWAARFTPVHWGVAALGYLVACVLAVRLYMHLVWSWYARPLRQALREMGRDICVNCGYWLRGLNDDVRKCPECGAERVKLPEQSP